MGETEGERKKQRNKREKRTVKVIWWDGESQSKENREAHQMRDREGGKRTDEGRSARRNK